PRVTGPLAEQLEVLGPGVDAEHGAGEGVLFAAALDVAVVKDAVKAVQPAVRAPGQGVGQLVGVGAAEAGDHHLRRAGRLAVGAFLVKEQVRGVGHPDAAVADRDAAGDVETLGEDGDLVVGAVAFGTFQDLDAVLAGAGGASGVLQAFGDPDAAAVV